MTWNFNQHVVDMYRNICGNFWVDTYIFSYRKVILNFVLLLRRTKPWIERSLIARPPPWNLPDWLNIFIKERRGEMREKEREFCASGVTARALGCHSLSFHMGRKNVEGYPVLYNSNWWRRNCLYIYIKGTEREDQNFASFRSVPFGKKGIVKKKESLLHRSVPLNRSWMPAANIHVIFLSHLWW